MTTYTDSSITALVKTDLNITLTSLMAIGHIYKQFGMLLPQGKTLFLICGTNVCTPPSVHCTKFFSTVCEISSQAECMGCVTASTTDYCHCWLLFVASHLFHDFFFPIFLISWDEFRLLLPLQTVVILYFLFIAFHLFHNLLPFSCFECQVT